MDILNTIGQFIGQFGFPIVACGVMFWQNYDENKKHKEESGKFADAINNNTIAITKMTALLEDALSRKEER